MSTRARRHDPAPARCFGIEVAAGRNRRARGLLHRDLQLALAAAQLGYRVRAVVDGGRVGPSSEPVAAGKPSA